MGIWGYGYLGTMGTMGIWGYGDNGIWGQWGYGGMGIWGQWGQCVSGDDGRTVPPGTVGVRSDAQRSYEELSALCSEQNNFSASRRLLLVGPRTHPYPPHSHPYPPRTHPIPTP